MTNLSSAFGHAIVPINNVDRNVRQVRRGYGTAPDELIWRPGCSSPYCQDRPEYETRYNYVTRRDGRVTYRLQYWCKAHGEAFARKHDLTLEPLP